MLLAVDAESERFASLELELSEKEMCGVRGAGELYCWGAAAFGQLGLAMLAAILIEPLQGEGGYLWPPEGFLAGLRALCDEHGILLIGAAENPEGSGSAPTFFAGSVDESGKCRSRWCSRKKM